MTLIWKRGKKKGLEFLSSLVASFVSWLTEKVWRKKEKEILTGNIAARDRK